MVEVCKEATQFGGEITVQAINSLCHLLLLLDQGGTPAEGLHLPIVVVEDVMLSKAPEFDKIVLKERCQMLVAFCNLISNNVLPVKFCLCAEAAEQPSRELW